MDVIPQGVWLGLGFAVGTSLYEGVKRLGRWFWQQGVDLVRVVEAMDGRHGAE